MDTVPVDIAKAKAEAADHIEFTLVFADGDTPAERVAVAVKIEQEMVGMARKSLAYAEAVLAEVERLAGEVK